MFKKFAGAVAVIGAVAIAGFVGFKLLGSPFTTTTRDRSATPVLTELRDLAEFHAAQARFEVTLDLEKDVKWVPSAIAGERVQFLGVGSVDAIVGFGGLGSDAISVSNDGKGVVITLPKPYAANPVLDHDASHVMNRDRGLLNRLGGVFNDNPTSEQSLYQAASTKMENAAAATDLLARGERHTRQVLTGMLKEMGFDRVEIRFEAVDTI